MAETRKRTRDGCLVCRRRRKRCDLRKPTCGGCKRNVLLCRWALTGNADDQSPIEAEALIPTHQSLSLQVTSMGFGIASQVLNAPISSLLYEHYLHETGNAISARRGPLNSFTQILPRLAMSYPNTVLQSLLALSGVHYGSRVSNVEVNIMTFTHLGVALRSLKHSLTALVSTQTNSDSLQLLVTTLILCFIEVTLLSFLRIPLLTRFSKTIRADEDGNVIHHLKAANVLFNRLITSREQILVDEEVLEFLNEFYAYIKSISVLTGSSISEASSSNFIESATPLLVGQRNPGNLVGCAYELFNLVPQIEDLLIQGRNYSDTTPKHELDPEWCRSYTKLHAHLSSWQPPECATTELALGGSMYQQALLCHIEKTSPFIAAQDLETTIASRMTYFLEILSSLPAEAPVSSTIVWPVVFFGVLTNNQTHRVLIYDRLSHMQDMFGFGNIQSSMTFLRSYWDRQGETSGLPDWGVSDGISDLSSIMKQMNLDISLL
ncbi:hypothetical protein N7540_004457 [Penicillium herquei]|nr:hypothetical protein N7540_004457 [Penicillium herquei]